MDKKTDRANPSDLVKGSKPENAPQLTEAELGKVSGGTGNFKIGDIKGESTDDKHKDWISISS